MSVSLPHGQKLLTEEAEAARASEGRWPRIYECARGWTSLEARRPDVL